LGPTKRKTWLGCRAKSLRAETTADRDLNVICLRAGYFMENTLALIGMLRAMGKPGERCVQT
jgi:hypothetical protein